MITENTYIISDTHFGHSNIVRFCNRPINHEEVIIRNWKNTLNDNDTIIHLGDVALGKPKDIYGWALIMKELPGRKYLIKGNHDHSKSMKIYKGVFEILDPFVQWFSGQRVYFSHYPNHPTSMGWDINIHGHIHNNGYSPELGVSLDPDKTYCNVSVEVMNYTPATIKSILSRLGLAF